MLRYTFIISTEQKKRCFFAFEYTVNYIVYNLCYYARLL